MGRHRRIAMDFSRVYDRTNPQYRVEAPEDITCVEVLQCDRSTCWIPLAEANTTPGTVIIRDRMRHAAIEAT